ncbi:hypothetical protein PQU92_15595 [Asticcacaulis sp. BYS171W]|uniref:YopX protein domain-containing protein n=1 Tax=Asticcacaulis aquaticus TaxID=2984212 RepID=A0ABT5HXD9_9CAUL|nr:hypothetical protein [Asticcacaulis aquaticus]MDC7684709.1 hypothetical protein [Asticcacaulis aquaticus]
MSFIQWLENWAYARVQKRQSRLYEHAFCYDRDFEYKPGKLIQQFVNKTEKPMEVWIEMYPDLYTLQPGDELTIIYEQDPNWLGLGLHTAVYADSLQIHLQEFETAIVMINGRVREPENRVEV